MNELIKEVTKVIQSEDSYSRFSNAFLERLKVKENT
jgi:hypothetical protein